MQAKDAASARHLSNEAKALADAGADLLVIECVPAEVGSEISAAVEIPVIGIGAGRDCDGQVLVLYDVLGITHPTPRFAKDFLRGHETVRAAVAAYVEAVRRSRFPADEHLYSR